MKKFMFLCTITAALLCLPGCGNSSAGNTYDTEKQPVETVTKEESDTNSQQTTESVGSTANLRSTTDKVSDMSSFASAAQLSVDSVGSAQKAKNSIDGYEMIKYSRNIKYNNTFLGENYLNYPAFYGNGEVIGLINADIKKEAEEIVNEEYDSLNRVMNETSEEDLYNMWNIFFDTPGMGGMGIEGDYNVITLNEDLVSVTLNYDSYSGGAHPFHFNGGATYNLETGEKMTINDFVDNAGEKVLRLIEEERNSNPYIDETVEIPKDEDLKFYINGNKVVVIFNEYEIAAYAAGSFEFELDIEK